MNILKNLQNFFFFFATILGEIKKFSNIKKLSYIELIYNRCKNSVNLCYLEFKLQNANHKY